MKSPRSNFCEGKHKQKFRFHLTFKINYNMKKNIFLLMVFVGMQVFAQVGIGTSTPNENSILDIASGYNGGPIGGVIFPTYTLKSRTDLTTPILNPADGLIIYNDGKESHPKGLYYWHQNQWVKMMLSANGISQILVVKKNAATVAIPSSNTVPNILPAITVNSSTTDQSQLLNTVAWDGVVNNTVTGASVNGERITLPAGTYRVDYAGDINLKSLYANPDYSSLNKMGFGQSYLNTYLADTLGNAITEKHVHSAVEASLNFTTSWSTHKGTYFLKLENPTTCVFHLENKYGAPDYVSGYVRGVYLLVFQKLF